VRGILLIQLKPTNRAGKTCSLARGRAEKQQHHHHHQQQQQQVTSLLNPPRWTRLRRTGARLLVVGGIREGERLKTGPRNVRRSRNGREGTSLERTANVRRRAEGDEERERVVTILMREEEEEERKTGEEEEAMIEEEEVRLADRTRQAEVACTLTPRAGEGAEAAAEARGRMWIAAVGTVSQADVVAPTPPPGATTTMTTRTTLRPSVGRVRASSVTS
jgi:hypothetical protein